MNKDYIQLSKIWREPKKVTDTFIMVTHNVHEAVFMPDRNIFLRVRPEALVADPAIKLPRPREKYAHTEEFYNYERQIISLIERYSVATWT
jgi:ABC-type nitrate/sulfonate/bicarbonate transport system ATPase subunit